MSFLHIYFKKNIFYLKFFLYFNKTNIKNLKFYDFYFILINSFFFRFKDYIYRPLHLMIRLIIKFEIFYTLIKFYKIIKYYK